MVVLYSHLFKNFPQFFVIYTVKGFQYHKVEQKDVLEVKKKLVNNWHTCYTLVIQIFIDQVHDFPFCHLSPYARSQIQDTFKSIFLFKFGNMAAPRVILGILCEPRKPPPDMIHYTERLLNMESSLAELIKELPLCGQIALQECRELLPSLRLSKSEPYFKVQLKSHPSLQYNIIFFLRQLFFMVFFLFFLYLSFRKINKD